MIRLDDLTPGGASWTFDEPVMAGRADDLDTVTRSLRSAETRAIEHGEWVVLVVAYEAAAAFDPAMRTAPVSPPGTPFVWWQSFADRTAAPPIERGRSQVTSRERRPGRCAFPAAVDAVRRRIAAGDVYQVNVTDRYRGASGSPFDVYRGLVGVQRCAFGAYVEMDDVVIASASPELFFEWDGDTITCRPMKGTATRRPRAAEDDAAAARLLADEKERAENVMIVDLIRNDLGRIAATGSVRVPEMFTLERYETVWQLTSTVTARVPDRCELIDVLGALFPCGSVTGAPKIAAMSVIAELEDAPRGVYCGTIGVLAPVGHGPRAVCSVPIRTAVLDPAAGTFEYGAGAGVTWSSSPSAEDAEVQAKARILTRSHRPMALLETMRNDARGLRHAAHHVDRMATSARWFDIPIDRSAIEARLAEIEPSGEPERVRLLLQPDGAFEVGRSPLPAGPDVVRLAVDTAVTRSDDPYSCHKTTWRRHYDEAGARHPEAADVVLVNEHGDAIETTIATLAYRIGERWHVPPLTDGGLPGIARHHVLAEGRVSERSIPASELGACDELAVLNDLRGRRAAVLLA